MKRYIFNENLGDMNRIDTDVVIIGSGAAGLYTALNLDPGLKCVVINKSGLEYCNSMYAQGGIATVVWPNSQQDDPDRHFADTLVAGAGLCDKQAVRVLVDEAWSNIEQLIQLNVPFDMKEGKLLLTREGGHDRNRILHCGGDATGSLLTCRLQEAAAQQDNIYVQEGMFLSDIITDEAKVVGVVALDKQNKPHYFAASKVIIASGGIGRVYQNSTNDTCATGDGIAAAARAGAILKDMEFVQFHPTAFVYPNENGRFFLISEALRGEGGILRNKEGEAFMQGVHPLADLAPRDIVSRAIFSEMKKNNLPYVYLDITAKSRDFLKGRFPTIYAQCMAQGIDIAKDWIPVMPVQHYCMGGIQTDTDGQTNISGLYACGEAACTGVHGANRLASNSLLECLVFGRRCAHHINSSVVVSPQIRNCNFQKSLCQGHDKVDFDAYREEIRALTTKACGIIRNGKDLAEAYARMGEIYEILSGAELKTQESMETLNLCQIGLAILQACIQRKKSVGAHYRSDDENLGGSKNAE
jgi:L-aspartate oxidase